MNAQPKVQPQPQPKKTYAPPRLITYGAVRSLTQTGTAGGAEAAGMTTTFMATSDRTVKEAISRIGVHPLGIGLFLFDYKPAFRGAYGRGRQFGVMADEVEAVLPAAVSIGRRGHKQVDYAMLGITRPAR